MTTQAEIREEREAILEGEWVDKWQEIESDMMDNVPWRKLYERVGLSKSIGGRWTVAQKKFWAEYLRFVTEVYYYGGTLEELKRRITDQRIYNSRTYKRGHLNEVT